VQLADEHPKEEPVSEELEEAAKHYLYSNILYDDVYVGNPTDKDCIEMFKAGAKWQFENLMNKVIDWLPNTEKYVHINVDNNGSVHTVCYTDKMISDFREAMGVKI
jgi:hypothetical protein